VEIHFFQRPNDHNNKKAPQNCPCYDKSKKSNLSEFIKKAKKIHGDKYDYSKTMYINSKEPMKIFCREHQQFFWQNANNHLQGQGCPCGRNERISKSNSKYNQKTFIEESKKIHKDKYSYSLVRYVGVREKVRIICKKHYCVFEQTPYAHLRGAGCHICANEKVIAATKSNTKNFIKKAIKVHGDKYNYSLVNYINNHTKVKIICKKHHDDYFLQHPAKHLSGRGCPLCNSSDGENIIRGFLKNNNFVFKEQVKFDDCFLDKKLSFDFYVPSLNMLIEYNGIQHYEKIDFYHQGKYNFEYQQKRDKIKKEYCICNKINLLEIPYWEKNNIENILKRELGC
jgi:hypothetical protein